jgi:hypothetical protein
MTERRRWGKAGTRLTAVEANRIGLRRYRSEVDEETAHKLWSEGKLIPHRITMALDLRELYGPEVDAACGAVEPDVDRWEAGELYPTWQQLLLLAELTGFLPKWFFMPVNPEPMWTSLDIHMPGPRLMPPILSFKAQARTAKRTPDQGQLW